MKPQTLHIVVAVMFFFDILFVDECGADNPYFSRQPTCNTTVREGDTAYLQCAVKILNQVKVQWTGNGFGLGEEISGRRMKLCERYQFDGNKTAGEYNLLIHNTRLSDDGVYECQLTNRGARSRRAYLHVLVPPKRILLKPAMNGVIPVQYPSAMMTITCVVPDAKPAAEISWKVAGKAFPNAINSPPSAGSEEKLFTSSSHITLSTETLRNGSSVECIARQKALRFPMTKAAVLNVLHPPNHPIISGVGSDPIRIGEVIEVKCVSDGGNPPAKITWVIGDDLYNGVYQSSGMRAQSTLRYTSRKQDNGKYLKCIVNSTALPTSIEARERLEVYYPPDNIMIDCDPADGVEENNDITFTCQHTASNPIPTLEWLINGVKLPNRTSDSVGAVSFHTYTLTSEEEQQKIAVTLRGVKRENTNLDIKCRARIPAIAYSREVTVHPKVNYPPRKVSVTIENPLNSPMINIHPRNDSIASNAPRNRMTFIAGHTIRLSCEAKGGYPAPDLSWFIKNGGQVRAIETSQVNVETAKAMDNSISDEFLTSSSIEMDLKSTHNRGTVTCKASSAQYSSVTTSNVTLAVAFPPDTLRIDQFPQKAVAGNALSLTCETAASFPAATISWYKDGEAVNLESISQLPLKNGENGGYVSSSRLRLFPKDTDDGTEYTCQATVKPLRETIMQQYAIRVEYSPRFRPDQEYVFNATEGEQSILIKINIDSNPTDITFKWFRYVRSTETNLLRKTKLAVQKGRIDWDGNSRTLHVTGLQRADGGLYSIQAANTRGSVERNITLNVFYPPKIIRVTGSSASVNEGDSMTLRCDFKSHSLTPPRVVWLKEVPGMGRSDYNVTTYANHSLLSLTKLSAEDRGGYKCIVDNGVGDGDARSVAISLSYAPVFEKSTAEKVAVSLVEENSVTPKVSVECVVHSQPSSTVQWLTGNVVINVSTDDGFSIIEREVDAETVKSTLLVNTLDTSGLNKSSRYAGLLSEFTCKASNPRGTQMKVIKVVSQGPPDAPTSVFANNKTSSTSVTLAWKEGFNGGSNQSFLVQYLVYSKYLLQEKFYELRSKSPGITVTGLRPDKEYIFRVLAENTCGQSPPSGVIRVRTALPKETDSTPQIESVQTTQIFLFVAAALVAFTLIIVTSIIMCRRCRTTKKSYRPQTIETDCESLNAESSLSSKCSSAKSPESGKEDTEIIELQSLNECKRHLLESEDGASSIVTDQPYDIGKESCFERSQSTCGNGIAVYRQGGCNVLGECTFSSFKSLPEANNSPNKGILDFHNKRGTYLAPIRPTTDNFSRDNHEAKFRFDVQPTEECLRTYTDNVNDSHSDIQLPPRLQPYETVRPYASSCTVDPNSQVASEDDQLRALISHRNNGEYEDVMLTGNYHTLGSSHNCDFYSSNRGCVDYPDINCGINNTTLGKMATTRDDSYYTIALPTDRENSSLYPFRTDRILTASSSATDLCAKNAVKTSSMFTNVASTTDFPLPPLEVIKECHSQEMLTNSDSPSNFKSSFRRNHDGSARSSHTQSVRFHDHLAQTISTKCHVPVSTPSPQNLEHDSSDDDTDSGCGGSADVQVRRVVGLPKPSGSTRFASSHSTCGKSTELRELRV